MPSEAELLHPADAPPESRGGIRAGRDNSTWLEDLRGAPDRQARALGDLRRLLILGVRTGLKAGASLDDTFYEDVAQEALVRVLDHLDSFQGRSRFTTWALSIGVRVALTELRRRRWKDVSLESMVEGGFFRPQEACDPEATPDREAAQHEILLRLRQLIDEELTERQRTCLLAELKGMPQEEIARRLGSNRNAIYKLGHDLRKKLKQGLEREGVSAEDIRDVFA